MFSYQRLTKAQLIQKIEQLTATINRENPSGIAELLHDLEVHRVELEAQNQELRVMQKTLELALDRYAELYDFAPVGYLTLGHDGMIKEINLTGASLLGRERAHLVGALFTKCLVSESVPVFTRHMHQVCTSTENHMDELVIRTGRGQMLEVSMTSVRSLTNVAEDACRSVLIDITERRQNEEAVRRSSQLLRELSIHHEAVREEERKRVAREIHDELGQSLLALKMDVSMLNSNLDDASPVLKSKTKSMLELINRTIKSVRDISSNLRPAVLDLGLVPALEWLLDEFRLHTDIQCNLRAIEEDIQVADEVATGIFRIVQESLTNVARHAHATRINVALKVENGVLLVRIEDNGIGIDVGRRLSKNKSFGLTGIGERIAMMKGKFSITGKPGAGTVLQVTLPLVKGETVL